MILGKRVDGALLMSSLGETATIVFADICGSTQLFEMHGDVRARQIEAKVLSLLIDNCKQHDGEVIKTIGDEVMCRFPNLEKAIMSACEMQRSVTSDPSLALLNVAIRIGLHCGEVLCEDNDIFGDAVNTAARMASLSKPHQIITTQVTVANLSGIMRRNIRNLGWAEVRGKREQMAICEVIWQEDTSDLTTQFEPGKGRAGKPVQLILTYQGQTFSVNADSQPFSLGRNPNSCLMIDTKFVSRNHAYIAYSHGKFNLTDSSTNGTYVYLPDVGKIFLHRESFPLYGEGKISLGQDSEVGEIVVFTIAG